MKALVWYGTREVAFEDAAEPEPGADEVVLDVELAGICGSDLHGYRGHPGPRVPPLVLGHEVVGLVEGDAYAVYPLIGCGECEHCLAGEDNHCASWRLIGMHRQGVFAERSRCRGARSCRCRTGSTTSAPCWSSRSPVASARSRRMATRSSSRCSAVARSGC